MTYFAKQINPAYQDSMLFHVSGNGVWKWEDDFFSGISVMPRKGYYHTMTDIVENVYHTLESAYDHGHLGDCLDDFSLDDSPSWYKNRTECINDFLPCRKSNGKRYSTREIKRICELVTDYGYKEDTDILCEVLSIVTGQEYKSRQIHGCSQSDWREIIYPADVYSDEAISVFECLFFNDGSEWEIDDLDYSDDTQLDPEDISGYTIYCTSWNDDGIRKELAESIGCKPEQVIMYSHDGTYQVDRYRIA